MINASTPATAYCRLRAQLIENPQTWLITGVAGFIGSNLLETLLKLNQHVVGLDNFATGHQRNLDEVRNLVSAAQWASFRFMEGDIRNLADCRRAMYWSRDPDPLPFPRVAGGECYRVEYVLHQAALGSVPRSIEDPVLTNSANITGFLNMLVAARDAKVRRFVYAASSSTYGDHLGLPKVEQTIGKPLSPYAVTKYVNELYADVFAQCYGCNSIGLRYFNVFGKRQDPNGAYAAVIPKWTAAMLQGEPIYINGDGETSRDFCYIDNAIQANLLAARSERPDASNQVYNVAAGERTTLNALFMLLRDSMMVYGVKAGQEPLYRDFRTGDVRHSQADISKAANLLGYKPSHTVPEGIREAAQWYMAHQSRLCI